MMMTMMNTDLLLGRGADVQRQDVAGRTALSLASEHGFLDAVRLLMLHGASPETLDHKGRSPLDYAVERHQDDVVRFLLINESKGLKGQEMQIRESALENQAEKNIINCSIRGPSSSTV
uniref:Cyclin-dependent kinase inhibitor 2C (p18, inhibits CDK4) n=1 Tax=Astyanax mexicanus TaxID=7994 RepID=A0A8B9L3U7_ASTMX